MADPVQRAPIEPTKILATRGLGGSMSSQSACRGRRKSQLRLPRGDGVSPNAHRVSLRDANGTGGSQPLSSAQCHDHLSETLSAFGATLWPLASFFPCHCRPNSGAVFSGVFL